MVRESLRLDPWPVTVRPENLVLIVAGGGHPTNSYWLQGYSPRVVGREIHLPGLSTHFNFYAGAWTDFILRDVQENILEVVKRRAERRYP